MIATIKDYRKFVHETPIYNVRCSDCECYGDDYFNEYQAAQLTEEEGWLILGDNVRIVCNRCAEGYPSE